MRYRPSNKPKPLILGTDENFLDCEMDVKLREEHMHIIGAPRSGKSRFMLSLIQQDLHRNQGCCVIDPHGELVDHVKDWLAKNETITARRTVHILDYRDLEYSFGFNPLQVDADLFIDATVERAVDAVATANTGEGAGNQHLVIETLTDIFTALAYARLTLVEATYLLNPQYPTEREAITKKIKNSVVRSNWERHNLLALKSPQKYLEKFDAAARRINRMIGKDLTRLILGQTEGVLDLKRAMDEGDIILVDFSLEGGYAPPESANLLGRLLVSSFVAAAFQRTPRTSKPFNLYIDEVHKYLTYNISTILDECPKFGLHMTFAHQHLTQLAKADDNGLLLSGVMASAQNKICFKLGSPDDAEIMQRRIFAGHYDLETPKTSMNKPTVVGHEIVELRSESETRSSATTEGRNSAEAVSYMNSKGYTEGASVALSETDSESRSHSLSETHGVSEGFSVGESQNSSAGYTTSAGGGAAESSGLASADAIGVSASSGIGATIDQEGNLTAESETIGGGDSMSQATTVNSGISHSTNHNVGHSASHGSGTNSSRNQSINQATTESTTTGVTKSRGRTDTQSFSESISTGEASTHSQGKSLGEMRGQTQSRGSSQALAPILEERPTALYSLEELKHKFTDGILNLPKRTAFAIISGEGMVKLETLDVPDLIVSPSKRKRILHEIKQRSAIHKPLHEADHEIDERFKKFMERELPPIIEHDPMMPNPTPVEEETFIDKDPMIPDG